MPQVQSTQEQENLLEKCKNQDWAASIYPRAETATLLESDREGETYEQYTNM